MKSIRELYKIGRGPSSSHTMGPAKAAEIYASRHPVAGELSQVAGELSQVAGELSQVAGGMQPVGSFEVTLYGSLAATGKGHLTDVAITDVLGKIAPVEIVWKPQVFLPFHPNAMKFACKPASGATPSALFDEWTVYSIGGGALSEGPGGGGIATETPDLYDLNTITDIMKWCKSHGKGYWEYVAECEDEGIWDYLMEMWEAMKACVENGLENEGALPGPLHLSRKAATYYIKAKGYKPNLQSRGLVFAYALAASEENASGGTIVTAPTCGSCGVLPAVLYHMSKNHEFSDKKILHALATAGLFGNVVKHNASISGADVGCQGEVGVACAMASAATCQLFGGTPAQVEYAAEMGLEHHLGMTCDPVCGLVQIPCIERNAFAAARALDADIYATFSDGFHRVSFDQVVEAMKQTGHDLPSLYKETGAGGLAKGRFVE
ncbi:MAG: L-serine ammonia-lyase, iron-sulfur-dependent, subunit alpha [Bacteroidales bacterium]|nr:L-serine ammonia-lyase, iron-sulfur-dependent, subunit alpha [Bacteroidales bacterium]